MQQMWSLGDRGRPSPIVEDSRYTFTTSARATLRQRRRD